MKNFAFVSNKKWHDDVFTYLKSRNGELWYRINDKSEFTHEHLEKSNIEKVFIPHWSFIIPESIWSNFECIVFHMTDLPFGRGGSPLQNLIVRGLTETKISAIRVDAGIDTGNIYLKANLSLLGTAQEIFIRSAEVIRKMIIDIIENSPIPHKQTGEIVEFRRRKPEDSNISHLANIDKIYDHIRMLDCEGYPKAYIDVENIRFEFTRVSIQSDKSLIADVRIFKK